LLICLVVKFDNNRWKKKKGDGKQNKKKHSWFNDSLSWANTTFRLVDCGAIRISSSQQAMHQTQLQAIPAPFLLLLGLKSRSHLENASSGLGSMIIHLRSPW
jgi:hypothetical protein